MTQKRDVHSQNRLFYIRRLEWSVRSQMRVFLVSENTDIRKCGVVAPIDLEVTQ